MIYLVIAMVSIFISIKVPHWTQDSLRIKNFKIRFNQKGINRNLLIFLSALGPLLLSAFRYGIGTDYFYTYIPQFNLIANGGRSYYEYGFYLLNKIIALFTDNGQWLIIMTSTIFVLIVYHQLFRMAHNYALSLVIFFLSYNYFVSLNNIRQSLASAILLLAIDALVRQNKRLLFVFWVVVAGLLHRISVIYLVILIIEKISFSSIIYSVISVGMIGIGRIVLPRLLLVLSAYIPRLALYLNAKELQIYNGNTIGNLYTLVNAIFMIMLMYIDISSKPDSKELALNDRKEWEFTKLNQCIILCICGLDPIIPAAYRIVRIFAFSQFLFLPNVLIRFQTNKRNRMLLVTVLTLGMLAVFYQNFIYGAEEVFPYVSIFS